jgi:hypothetical protein
MGDFMTDRNTLLQQAERCRRLGRLCKTAAIARKFEALARDYEEHAGVLDKGRFVTSVLATADRKESGADSAICSSGRVRVP